MIGYLHEDWDGRQIWYAGGPVLDLLKFTEEMATLRAHIEAAKRQMIPYMGRDMVMLADWINFAAYSGKGQDGIGLQEIAKVMHVNPDDFIRPAKTNIKCKDCHQPIWVCRPGELSRIVRAEIEWSEDKEYVGRCNDCLPETMRCSRAHDKKIAREMERLRELHRYANMTNEEYYKTPWWIDLKARKTASIGGRCVCGKKLGHELHHKTYAHANTGKSRIQGGHSIRGREWLCEMELLCENCHMQLRHGVHAKYATSCG